MSALCIGPTERAALLEARSRALARPVPLALLEKWAVTPTKTLELKDRPPGVEDRPPSEHVEIPFGFVVCISFEEQPAGLQLHMSMSGPRKDRPPNIHAMLMVMDVLGMPVARCTHWLEEYGPSCYAVNAVSMWEDCNRAESVGDERTGGIRTGEREG